MEKKNSSYQHLYQQIKELKDQVAKTEWLHEKENISKEEPYTPYYGDVTKLNTERTILDTIGKEMLQTITSDLMDLLDTSVAIYEKNGDYAFGVFNSGWCQLLDASSRKLCNTNDNKVALKCGKWICHDDCWLVSKNSIDTKKAEIIHCSGELDIIAEPIYVENEVIGSVNIGYGNPPTDDKTLNELADKYNIEFEILKQKALDYNPRPDFIIEIAKKRLKSIAKLIGEIVSRKQIEQNLKASEEKYKRLVNNSNSLIIEVDAESYDVINCNPAMAKSLNKSVDQIVGENIKNLLPPNVLKHRIEQAEKALKENKVIESEDERNGKYFINHFIPVIINKNKRYIQTVSIDITEQKQAEQQLLHSKTLLKSSLESPKDIIILSIDKEYNYLYFNEAHRKVMKFAYNREVKVGINIMDCITDPTDIEKAKINYDKALQGISHSSVEVYGDKKKSYYETFYSPIFNEKNEIIGASAFATDITDRKQNEQELKEAIQKSKESEKRLRLTINQSPFPIAIVDIHDEHVLYWSLSAQQKFGHTPKIVTDWYELAYPDAEYRKKVIERWKPMLQKAANSPQAVNTGVYEITCKDGTVKTCELYLQFIPGNIIITFNDITELQEYQKNLKEKNEEFESINEELIQTNEELIIAKENVEKSEALYRKLFELNNVGIGISSYDGKVIEANRSICYTMGYTYHEFKGLDVRTFFVHKKDRETILNKIKKEGKVTNYITEFFNKSGEKIWVKISMQTIKFDVEKHLLVVVSDITKEKIAEAELKISEDKFRTLTEKSSVGMFLDDTEGRAIYINDKCAELIGVPAEQALNLDWIPFIHPDDKERVVSEWEKTIKLKKEFNLDYRWVHNNGEIVWTQGKVVPVKDEKGKVVVFIGSLIDITAQKTLEESLIEAKSQAEENEANVKAIIEGTNDSIWAFDNSYNIIYINKHFQQEFLQSFDVLLEPGVNIVESLPKPLRPLWKSRYDRVLANEFFKIEDRVPTNKGDLYVEVTFNPIVKKGKVIGGSCFGNDITFRKTSEIELVKAKEKAEESQESLSMLIENIPYAVFANDFEGKLILVNKMATKYTGYSKNELLNMEVADIDHKSISRNDRKHLWQKIKKGSQRKFESVHFRKDGTQYPVEINMTRLNYENQQIILLIAQDITDRKKAEQRLLLKNKEFETLNKTLKQINKELSKTKDRAEESEMKLLGMFNNTDMGLLFCNPKGEILDVNTAVIDILGSPSKEATKQINLLTFKPLIDAGFSEKVQQSIRERKNISGEVEYKSKWGLSVYMRYQLIPLLINKKLIGIWINLNNLTDLWKSQQELIKAKEKAEEADRLKSAFLANMSHEIRTPMNGILGFTDLLKEHNLTGKQQEKYIQIIKKSGDRMLATVNDIIDISKIDAGEMEISKEEINAYEEIESQYEFFKEEAHKKGLELTMHCTLPKKSAYIITDKVKLNSIISNLIKNAIKYTDKGSINISCSKKESNLEFSITDTGIGIPKNRINSIFNRFEQADIDDKHARQGSGLGLSITKAYVEMLEGQIYVESTEGKGSTFHFTIPWVENKKKKPHSESTIEINSANDQSINILIVEDDDISFEHLNIIFHQLGHKISRVTRGEEAIEYMKKNPDTDLIMMDIKLPGMNGTDATKEIRTFNKEVIIIAETAYALSGDKEKFISVGCNDYIAKPITKASLIEKINDYF